MIFIFLLLFSIHPAEAYEFQSSGDLRFSAGQIFSPNTKEITYQSLAIEPSLRSTRELKKNFNFNFDTWGSFDPLNQSTTDVFQLELNEFSIDHTAKGRRLKFGYSIRNWEGTDLINPMDLLHGKNWVDPLNGRARSGLGFFYDDAFGDFLLDFTYIFRQQTHRLPGSESPWWPRSVYLPTESESLVLLLNNPLEYRILDEEVLDHALDHNLALRLRYVFSDFEIAVAVTDGLANPPLITPLIEGDVVETSPRQVIRLRSPIEILPIIYRQRAIAGTFVWTLGDFILRVSANHIQPIGDDERLPSWSQLGVIGLERTFYLGNQMVTLLGQFIDSKRPDVNGVTLLTSLFQKSYMTGIRYAPSERWTYLFALFQETTTWSKLIRNEITWSFKDTWSLSGEITLFEGPEESAIGTYDRNDSGYLRLKKSF